MNFDYHLSDIDALINFIKDHCNKGWIGSLDFIRTRYNYILKSMPYDWYFCKGLSSDNIDENMKGNLMEADALLCNLYTLKGRLLACEEYSTFHINVEFDDIKKIIIDSINNSILSIEIAIAWLTNDDIIQSLRQKLNNSVSIRIILNDDPTNADSIRKLSDYKIPLKKCPPGGLYNNNIMHNKFCIFDNSTIITGSYNWTNSANYNNENIVIITNQDLANKFLLQFNKLWMNN